MEIYDFIGYFAIFFSIGAFITKSRKTMLIFGIVSTLLFGISIFGYGGINGLVVSLISIFIKLCSLYLPKNKVKYLQLLALPFSLLLFLFVPEGIEGIIPVLSIIFIIIADSQKDLIKMKQWYYGSNLLWLSYGIILFSPSAILFDILGFIAITYGIYINKRKYI